MTLFFCFTSLLTFQFNIIPPLFRVLHFQNSHYSKSDLSDFQLHHLYFIFDNWFLIFLDLAHMNRKYSDLQMFQIFVALSKFDVVGVRYVLTIFEAQGMPEAWPNEWMVVGVWRASIYVAGRWGQTVADVIDHQLMGASPCCIIFHRRPDNGRHPSQYHPPPSTPNALLRPINRSLLLASLRNMHLAQQRETNGKTKWFSVYGDANVIMAARWFTRANSTIAKSDRTNRFRLSGNGSTNYEPSKTMPLGFTVTLKYTIFTRKIHNTQQRKYIVQFNSNILLNALSGSH